MDKPREYWIYPDDGLMFNDEWAGQTGVSISQSKDWDCKTRALVDKARYDKTVLALKTILKYRFKVGVSVRKARECLEELGEIDG